MDHSEVILKSNECVSHLLAPYPMSEYDFPEPVWPYANSEQL